MENSRKMEVEMGKSSINGGLSIAMFDMFDMFDCWRVMGFLEWVCLKMWGPIQWHVRSKSGAQPSNLGVHLTFRQMQWWYPKIIQKSVITII